jgi:hypothetical protein
MYLGMESSKRTSLVPMSRQRSIILAASGTISYASRERAVQLPFDVACNAAIE